jgi:CheY-like chemotaxis protein
MSVKKNILIVDDDKNLRRSLAITLNYKGFNASTVESGQNAIKAVGKDDFDLILIDVIMPDMNGLETLRALKEISPGTRVVMMTGFAVADLVTEAIKTGVDGVLYKPFDVSLVMKNLLSQDVFQLFEGYLQSVWDRICPVIGPQSAHLIFNQSVEKVFQHNGDFLPEIEVTENRISLNAFHLLIKPDNTTAEEESIRPLLQNVLAEIFDLLSMLTGEMLTSPLIEKLSGALKADKE